MGIAAEVVVRVRRHDGDEVEEYAWPAAYQDLLSSAAPWRVFRWRRGQKHYSGTCWSATMRDHVIYESRLELARLLFADFDRSAHGIVAHPILLQTGLEAKAHQHIPDFLRLTDQVPVIVDAKPLHRLSKPEVAFTFHGTRQAVEAGGWKQCCALLSMAGPQDAGRALRQQSGGCSQASHWPRRAALIERWAKDVLTALGHLPQRVLTVPPGEPIKMADEVIGLMLEASGEHDTT